MSRIVIIAVGSRGDVAPLTGVGVALQRAGHTVSIAAYTPFADMITDCGLGFHELPAELELAADGAEVQPVKGLAAFASPTGMRALRHDILAAVDNEPADIALLSPFAEMAGHPWAESRGIPAIGVRLQPLSATAHYPPAILGAWSAGAAGNRGAARMGAWLIDRIYGKVVADFRRELGLPRVSTRALRKQRTDAHWPVLHGYSPLVAPRPPDWRPDLEVTGCWWPADSGNWTPPTELTRFLSAGPPPVFVGFGSLMVSPDRAEQLSNLIGQAAVRAGVRVLVQAGWTSLHVADDTVMTIGDTPHDGYFPGRPPLRIIAAQVPPQRGCALVFPPSRYPLTVTARSGRPDSPDSVSPLPPSISAASLSTASLPRCAPRSTIHDCAITRVDSVRRLPPRTAPPRPQTLSNPCCSRRPRRFHHAD